MPHSVHRPHRAGILLIYQVFDIDGTLAHYDGWSVHFEVLNLIKSFDSTKNRLFFLTARWEAEYESTFRWLVQVLGHENFRLHCRSILHQFSIASYKRTVIDSLWQGNPAEIHFYDDDMENLANIKRYRRHGKKPIYLYHAQEGKLTSLDSEKALKESGE